MAAVKTFAPAKVNLALHVTGQRVDGYHLLDTLVAFAPVGDVITIEPGNGLSLSLNGPEAEGLVADEDNLVLRAAAILARGQERGARITLTKNLPVASGIGGGSADAAATLRGLLRFWGLDQGEESALAPFAQDILELGADIPMCLTSHPARVQGIGEKISLVPGLGPIPALLVNPRVGVSTPEVFRALHVKENPPLPNDIPRFEGVEDFADWLGETRNDLEIPARRATPEIGHVLEALSLSESCLLARMSGSGATCFGLYPDRDAVTRAAGSLRQAHPDWWIAGGSLGDMSALATPRPDAPRE